MNRNLRRKPGSKLDFWDNRLPRIIQRLINGERVECNGERQECGGLGNFHSRTKPTSKPECNCKWVQWRFRNKEALRDELVRPLILLLIA